MSGFELTVVQGGVVVHAVPLGEAPLRVGRAPANELVIADDSVSWNHAQVWVEGPRAWVQDLASRNGTFVNDDRIHGPTPVTSGDRLRVGERVELRIRGGEAVAEFRLLQLEDLDAGVRFPLRSDRFHIGSGDDAHLRLPDGPSRAATIGISPDGDVWIGDDDGQRALQVGVPFEVGGRKMQVLESTAAHAPTVEYGAHKYPYEVHFTFDGPSGPQALLLDPDRSVQKLFTRNRGLLLCLLCEQLRADRHAQTTQADEGWCNDTEIAVKIWGRANADANKLHVLIHRLRKAVEGAGFDPWFVEKRQWGVRARLRHVKVQE